MISLFFLTGPAVLHLASEGAAPPTGPVDRANLPIVAMSIPAPPVSSICMAVYIQSLPVAGSDPEPGSSAISSGADQSRQLRQRHIGLNEVMPPPLRDLLPGRGLRRGSTVAVRGSTAMLAAATRAGCWCAVAGMPNLSLLGTDELGVDLERHRGPRPPPGLAGSGRSAARWH